MFDDTRRSMLAELRLSFATAQPRSLFAVTGITDGGPVAVGPEFVEVLVGGRLLRIHRAARDRYGSPAALLRLAAPQAGYTRHTLGDRELERDVRRQRRRHGR